MAGETLLIIAENGTSHLNLDRNESLTTPSPYYSKADHKDGEKRMD